MSAQPSEVDVQQDVLDLYERMALIRAFETRVSKLFVRGKLPGFVHLYSGQEAVATGVCDVLEVTDRVFSTHRGHGHALAKGVDPDRLMAELHGKATGVCQGKGGSMHVADASVGFMSANGIVNAGAPMACGSALASQVAGSDEVTVVFFGDGAVMQGMTHEALNLAAVWQLPVVFVCENNFFAQSTSKAFYTKIDSYEDFVAQYGIPGVTVDGNDIAAVRAAAADGVAAARGGGGPQFIEAVTWRHRGHFEGDQTTYQTDKERELRRTPDPIERVRTQAAAEGWVDRLDAIDERVKAAIDAAVESAEQASDPAPEELLTNVYNEYPRAQLAATNGVAR